MTEPDNEGGMTELWAYVYSRVFVILLRKGNDFEWSRERAKRAADLAFNDMADMAKVVADQGVIG